MGSIGQGQERRSSPITHVSSKLRFRSISTYGQAAAAARLTRISTSIATMLRSNSTVATNFNTRNLGADPTPIDHGLKPQTVNEWTAVSSTR